MKRDALTRYLEQTKHLQDGALPPAQPAPRRDEVPVQTTVRRVRRQG